MVSMPGAGLWSAGMVALSGSRRGDFRLPALLPALVSVPAGRLSGPRFLSSHGGVDAGHSAKHDLEGDERVMEIGPKTKRTEVNFQFVLFWVFNKIAL